MMAEKDAIVELKAGKLYQFTDGEFSDYYIRGTFVALRDVPATEVVEIANYIKRQNHANGTPYYKEHDSLLPALIRAGVLLDVDATEVHVYDFMQKATWEPNDAAE